MIRVARVRWRWATETALHASVEADDLAGAARAAHALRRRVTATEAAAAASPELVVGAASLLVRFALPPGECEVAELLALTDVEVATGDQPAGREHRFEVAYGGADGPDLVAVAERLGRSAREVVASHAGAAYVVGFVGFSPGFGYLLGLPRELELPRRASPRARVPAGSVAIAGPFAGIYPQPTPGGWHLLGRCDATLFDPAVDPPSRLAPGDRVRFVPR